MTLKGITGTAYRLDPAPIGSGGEGDVHRASITKIVKLYKPGVMTTELENKLRIMTENPPNEAVLTQVAWPLDLIYDDNAQCKGFAMPELSVNAELGDIYRYPSAIPISVHKKINIAQNICAVISEVHKAGYVFGDFNPRNIGLDKDTGLVSFLDTDSYHVEDPAGETTYRCTVCAPGYAAPELLKKCSDYVSENPAASKNAYAQTPLPTFTKETDNFALAIHIFKLLMNGYTPFGGIIETASVSQSSPGVGDSAVRRDSYCWRPGYKPQSAAIPALEAFPREIADLFTRAFIVGRHDPKQRPAAAEWHSALGEFAKSSVTCRDNPLHSYDSKNDSCPYCEADGRLGAILNKGISPATALKQTAYAPPPPIVAPPPVVTPKQTAAQPVVPPAQHVIPPAYHSKKAKAAPVKHSKNDMISAGANHSAAIAADGRLYTWGKNKHGQLGNGTYSAIVTPPRVLSNMVAVSAGDSHTMAIKSNGTLWAWGDNINGQLGVGTSSGVCIPACVLSNVAAVSAGDAHTLAIKNDGSLLTWGGNSHGQLGNGTFANHRRPVMIMDDVKAVAAGHCSSAAITVDGRLFVWGQVSGSGYDTTVSKPDITTPKYAMDDALAVSLGLSHAMAVTSDGSLWAWGWNDYGQLGCSMKSVHMSSRMRIMDDVVAVSAGGCYTLAITADGGLCAWGRNNMNQLGNGGGRDQYKPVRIMGNAVAVFAGQTHALAITADDAVWTWGSKKAVGLDGYKRQDFLSPLKIEL